ncbi:MAG TPA: SRPBCC domain-containing protein [Acidimicrobiia bacterium]|nr:SRPBCC domain-containing protein [Acidimicrobiia bacterium]
MITQLFKKRTNLSFERSYAAPVEAVWHAWTRCEILREWWGPDKTTVPECEIDLRVGGTIFIVTEAGEGMGKYQGTRWPMAGTFSLVEDKARLSYDARSWTEGEEQTSTIHHVNDLTMSEDDGTTNLALHVSITQIGSGAKMAAFGMKWGYKQQLDHLEELLSLRS